MRRISGWAWLFAVFLSWSAAAADVNAQAEVVPSASAALSAQDNVQAVTRTVLGILGYTRWPMEGETLQLCMVGASEYAAGLLHSSGQIVGGRRLAVKSIRLEQLKEADCHGIYVGDMDEPQWRQLMRLELGHPLLTISERSALCRIGAMFCLSRQSDGPGFEINLDSIARSGLRVSPKVLQLARTKAEP